MTLSFASSTAGSRLQVLVSKNELFKSSPLDMELANELCVVGWSLCDWVFKEHGTRLGFSSLKKFQLHSKSQCAELAIIQDVANATKHKDITTYTPILKEAKYHGGGFSSGFSRGFDISRLMVVKTDGSEAWFLDVIDVVVRFWTKYFDDQKIA